MQDFWPNWFMLVTVFTVALASPGPDFIMAVRNSVMGSRKAGIFTAIGFGLGVSVHVAYCLAGLALIISQSVMLFNIIKWVGAAYLFYVGYQAIRSKGYTPPENGAEKTQSIKPFQALQSGFVTNLLNPKATLFFLALFTQILSPDIDLNAKIAYGMTCIAMTIIWFSIVATVLTTARVRTAFLRLSKWIDRACGVLFIALGIKLAVTRL